MKQNSIWTIWEGYCVRLYDEIHRHPLESAKSEIIICTLRIKPLPLQADSKTSEGQRGRKRSSHCDTQWLCQSAWKELASAPSVPFIKPVKVRKEANTKAMDTSVCLPGLEPEHKPMNPPHTDSAAACCCGQESWCRKESRNFHSDFLVKKWNSEINRVN